MNIKHCRINKETNTVRLSILANKARIKELLLAGDKDKAKFHTKKRRMYLSQRGKCCFCDMKMLLDSTSFPQGRQATCEHIVPRLHGGFNGWKNFAISCHSCNNLRGVTPFEEFRILRQTKSNKELKELQLTRFSSQKEKDDYKRLQNLSRLVFTQIYHHYQKHPDYA